MPRVLTRLPGSVLLLCIGMPSRGSTAARSAWARVFGQQIDNRYETYTDAPRTVT